MITQTNTTIMDITITNGEWKNKNKTYLCELQSFLDKAENIENEDLKKDIILQMLRCDKILTLLAEQNFIKFYKKGYEDCKEK